MKREGNEPTIVEGLARLRTVLSFIGKRLAGADAYLIQTVPLDNLASALASATSEIQIFVGDGNAGHISIANQHADLGLSNLQLLHVPYTTEDYIAAKEAAESYRRGLDHILATTQTTGTQTRTDIETLRSQISELTKEVVTERARLTSLASEHQSQFSSAQEMRSVEWRDVQRAHQEKLTLLMTEYADNLTANEVKHEQKMNDIIKQHATTLSDLRKEFVETTSRIREEVIEHKNDVEVLVGVIGNRGVTSGYQKSANEARTTARVWQGVAVLSMIGLIGVAVCVFLPALQVEFSWPGFAGRVFISLTIGALAAYAGSQADKYQKIERRSRKLALELEAIGPYIAALPLEKQVEFRLKIGERTFGQEDAGTGINEKSPVTFVDFLNTKEGREFIVGILKLKQ